LELPEWRWTRLGGTLGFDIPSRKMTPRIKKVTLAMKVSNPNGDNPWTIFGAGVIPAGKIMQISVSPFAPGQSCPDHVHRDLWEIFICECGQIDMRVDGETILLSEKEVVLVKPGQSHGLTNNSDQSCELLIMGIACPDQ
jgi:quercetin dioxygenase-like cupin family protein